jgi:N-acetylmuramic acid 6-phosphate (MurNAc-6-P) etherase
MDGSWSWQSVFAGTVEKLIKTMVRTCCMVHNGELLTMCQAYQLSIV